MERQGQNRKANVMTLDADEFRCGAGSVVVCRNSRDWQQLIEMRRAVDIVQID